MKATEPRHHGTENGSAPQLANLTTARIKVTIKDGKNKYVEIDLPDGADCKLVDKIVKRHYGSKRFKYVIMLLLTFGIALLGDNPLTAMKDTLEQASVLFKTAFDFFK